MEKILITGVNGQIGSELRQLSKQFKQYEWVFTGRQELDLCDIENLESEIIKINPTIIINCAGYTSVDKAELEFDLSNLSNHLSVAIIARWCHTINCKLIHISTDYVFDGDSYVAIKEDAQTNPINVYGVTKLAGEKACLQNNPNTVLIRTSWVFSVFGNNFVKKMTSIMQERESLNIVNDQIGSPTYATDLADAIMTILNHEDWKPGIYNFSNEGEVSWYEFAISIKEIANFDCKIFGIPSSLYPTPAKRPAYSLLDKSKIKSTFGVEVPDYKMSLKKCIKLLKANKKT